MHDYKELFQKYRFAWYGQRALDCVGLEDYLALDLVMCCDFGQDTPFIAEGRRPNIYSLEASTHVRENWTSAELDRILFAYGAKLDNYLHQTFSVPVHIVAYSATASLVRFACRHSSRLHLIMPDLGLKTWLDDKTRFAQVVHDLGLLNVESRVIQLAHVRFNQLKQEFGLPFVLQLPFGSASSGTFFVSEQSDLEKVSAVSRHSTVLVSQYIRGVSLNVNASVLGRHVAVASPSIQLIGMKECSRRREAYCGNDYSAARSLPPRVISEARSSVKKIGNWLGDLGYQGMFGVDLVADLEKEVVYPLDLNPRFQNSTHLLTQAEMVKGRLPLSLLSIAWQMGLIGDHDVYQWCQTLTPGLDGAQVILHSLSGCTQRVNEGIAPGIYSSKGVGGRLRHGISLLDRVSENEIVVSCGVPRPGTEIVPGAPLMKVFTLQSVADVGASALYPWMKAVCHSIYDRLDLTLISGNSTQKILHGLGDK